MKKSLWAVVVLFCLGAIVPAHAIDRKSLAAYAASLKGKKKAELKAALETLMKPSKVLGYGSGTNKTWWGFYQTDRNPQNNECYNRYSSEKFYFSSSNKGSAISGMNIEHSFPKSWWGGSKNNAYMDLYNLYPSDAAANSSKSNYAMGKVENVKTQDEGYDKVGTGTINGKSGVNCWEPGDQYKGDFSRGYMYMAVVYGSLTYVKTGLQTMSNEDYPGLNSWASKLYIEWEQLDKVDSLECARNNAVAKIQGNRNLFVDYPNLAQYVWGDSVDVAFDPETALTTASDDNRYAHYTPGPDPEPDPTPDPTPDPEGQEMRFVKVDYVAPGELYMMVVDNGSSLCAIKPYTGNGNAGYMYTTTIDYDNDTINAEDFSYVFTFAAQDEGYTIKDVKNRYYNTNGTETSFSLTTDPTEAATWTFEPTGTDGTFYIESEGRMIQYSNTYLSVGCYDCDQDACPMLFKQYHPVDAIHSVDTARKVDHATIYTIQGQAVGTDATRLPHGLYIKEGKKFVIR